MDGGVAGVDSPLGSLRSKRFAVTKRRPNGKKSPNPSAWLYVMQSEDLENWIQRELWRANGPDVPLERMGQMIASNLLLDKNKLGKWSLRRRRVCVL